MAFAVNVGAKTTLVSGGAPQDHHSRGAVKRRGDGVLVCVYRTGSHHAINDGALHVIFSDNEGASWTDPDTTLSGAPVIGFPMNPSALSAGEDAGEPWLYIAPSGDLVLHMWRADYAVTANGTYQSRSSDGESWSPAVAVDFAGIADDAKVFATDDDFVLDGVIYAGARVYFDVGPSSCKSVLIRSLDDGASWEWVSDISDFTNDTIEVGLEYVGNSTIVAVLRSLNNSTTYLTRSTNLGASWATLANVNATIGVSGRHRIYTRAHLQGQAEWWDDPVLIMVGFENQTPGSSQPRRNCIWLSPNRGLTWEGPHYLDVTVEDAGYGDIFYDAGRNEYVVVTYSGDLTAADLVQYRVAITFESALTSPADGVVAWVTSPAGAYIAHLDRSVASPFRNFRFYRERATDGPGGGSFEYHADNAVVRENPGIVAKGNLVWMLFRGRTTVWTIDEEAASLGSDEHAGDWRVVAGAGCLQLLGDRIVFPPGFNEGSNLDPATWSTQWRSFVNRAAGELLWDLIDESNDRFETQITRGTVGSSGTDGVTINYRFENILADVVGPVLDLHGGSVVMEGLAFNYYDAHGVDRRDDVIFEEGADVLTCRVTSSEKEALTWVVGEGVGEGVFAKLAVAERSASRRREAFVAAKEAGNLALLQLMADAALNENAAVRGVEVSVDESRFRAFEDYDIDDVIRVIVPSRDVDDALGIVAIYVGEESDRISVNVDLGMVREDDALRLDRQLQETRQSVGVRNRQPQGQLVPFSFSGADVFDSTDTMDVFFLVPERMYVLIEARAELHFREFFASAQAAAAVADQTSTSGGGSTSGSGGGATPTSSSTAAHRHMMAEWRANVAGGVERQHDAQAAAAGGALIGLFVKTSAAADLYTQTADGGHSHTVDVPAHQHSTPAHQHTVPGHSHTLTYGVFKEALPVSHSVAVGVYRRNGSSWDLVASVSGLTDDIEDIDLTPWVDGAGSWRLSIQSAGGQPNGGRLGCDVSGYVLGAIQSA